MKNGNKALLKGLALLTLTLAVTGGPMFGSALTFIAATNPVELGGQFSVSRDGGASFSVYCVDDNNTITIGETEQVNVSTIADLSNTRYGTTPTANFSFGGTYTAAQRYLMAGYLTEMYNFGAGGNATDNEGIQSASWELLTSNGKFVNGDPTSTTKWLNNATSWLATSSAQTQADLAKEILIYSDASLAGLSLADRTFYGHQEQVQLAPEPTTLVLLFGGTLLFLFGNLVCIRRTAAEPAKSPR